MTMSRSLGIAFALLSLPIGMVVSVDQAQAEMVRTETNKKPVVDPAPINPYLAEADKAEKELAAVGKQVADVRTELGQLKTERSRLEGEVKKAEKEAKDNKDSKEAKEAKAELQKKLAEVHKKVNALVEKVKQLDKEYKDKEIVAVGARATATYYRQVPPQKTADQIGRERKASKAATAKIDAYFHELWKNEKVKPVGRCDDATFCRRVSLDLVGHPLAPEQIQKFLADTNPNKRAELVEKLIADPQFADYWGLRLRQWCFDVAPVVGQGTSTLALFEYFRESLAMDLSYPAMAADLVTARGANNYNGDANFIMLWEAKPPELAAATSRMFLGINLQCAQCHDDMYEGWTQEDFWGMAALYTGMRNGGSSDKEKYGKRPETPLRSTNLSGGIDAIYGTRGENLRTISVSPKPAQVTIPHPTDPKQNREMPPQLLGESPLPKTLNSDERRKVLADWLTDAENPYFNRTAVNRVWMHFTGYGFVDSFDGFQPSEEVRHEELLDELCADWVAEGRHLQHLMRAICNSEVYQLETRAGEAPKFHEYAVLRDLDEHQWHAATVYAAGLDRRHQEEVGKGKKFQGIANHIRNIIKTTRFELARPTGPTAAALRTLNGDLATQALKEGLSSREIMELEPKQRLDAVFLASLGRTPRADERKLLEPMLQRDPKNPRNDVEDLLWILINSTEFNTH